MRSASLRTEYWNIHAGRENACEVSDTWESNMRHVTPANKGGKQTQTGEKHARKVGNKRSGNTRYLFFMIFRLQAILFYQLFLLEQLGQLA